MNILEELWNGQICPSAHADYRNEELLELAVLYERNEKELVAALNDLQKENLKKMQELQEEVGYISNCAAFISGFRLAVQLMSSSV